MKTKLWIARDKNGEIFLYNRKPIKVEEEGAFMLSDLLIDGFMRLSSDFHPEITFENSPQEIEI